MLIKEIKMHNFRQFVDSKVVFSTDPQKNVTIVMGDNGTGKTTLAQAFLWCLYADTDFKIKEVLNKKVRDTLPPGGRITASVTLSVEYNDIDYTIDRSQVFEKVQTKVNQSRPELKVYYKKDGNLEYLNENKRYILIKQMLPQQLSRFFFFDGERIRVMSDEINEGKSQEFKDAVAGLVGLTSTQNAIQHLRPSSTESTVIGYYNKKVNITGDSKVKDYVKQIESAEAQQSVLSIRLSEIEPQIKSYAKEEVELTAKIMNMEPEFEIKEKYKTLESDIDGLEKRKQEKIEKGILSGFGKHLYDFITAEMIEKVTPELDNIKESKADIPIGLEGPTLKYLLQRGRCICGEPLVPGEDHFNAINELLSIAPPKTTGKYVNEVKEKNRAVQRNKEGLFDEFEEHVKAYRDLDEKIEEKNQEAADTFNRLSDTSEGERAKIKLKETTSEKERLTSEQVKKTGLKQNLDDEIRRLNHERDKLVNIDESNRQYIRYLAYAEKLYSVFTKSYTDLEKKTRDKLEEKINEIFSEIYDGGLRIELDDKYNIKVLVDDNELNDDEIEKNTAQSYSIIFAFIASVIAMAKDKVLSDSSMTDEEKEIFSEAEGYPLVMDAPLSNFDKKRIQQICTIIPSIAKQVVFFIKDTDGEIAEKHMAERIGRRYTIRLDNGSKTHSIIEEDTENV